jgi:hypothetical protein
MSGNPTNQELASFFASDLRSPASFFWSATAELERNADDYQASSDS